MSRTQNIANAAFIMNQYGHHERWAKKCSTVEQLHALINSMTKRVSFFISRTDLDFPTEFWEHLRNRHNAFLWFMMEQLEKIR